MTLTTYVAGFATLAVIAASLALCAVTLRRRWLSGWTGAPARLAEIIVALGLFVVMSEWLGTLGLFRRIPLVLTASAIGIGSLVFMKVAPPPRRKSGRPLVGATPPWAPYAGGLLILTVLLAWTAYVRDSYQTGILGVDSLQYHLPFAARYAQTAYVSRLNFVWFDPVTSFYPNNAELFHAVGMIAFTRDVASPLINLFWLALAFLAAWVLGRPAGVGHLTVGATALVFAAPLTAGTQAGSALNDTAAVALVLAAIALLAQGDRGGGVIAIAGLAAGLAVGTKLSALAPVLVLTLAVCLVRRNRRASISLVWIGAAAVGGCYWYVRNLIHTGSPIPVLALPGLHSVRLPSIQAYGHSVSEYLDDWHFWTTTARTGLRGVFGTAFPVVVLLAGAGILSGVITLTRGRRDVERPDSAAIVRSLSQILLIVALGAGTAYVFTPASAYGPLGNPYLFGPGLRYGFVALLAALFLTALATVGRRPLWAALLMCITLAATLFELHTGIAGAPSPLASRPRAVVAAVAIWLGAAALMRQRRAHTNRRLLPVACSVVVVTLVGVVGLHVSNTYLHQRYKRYPLWAWARTVQHARIAVVGYSAQYPLTGLDLSNWVQYLGRPGSDGAFASYRDCNQFRSALHSGRYEFLVVGDEKWGLEAAPEQRWASSDPSTERLLQDTNRGIDTTVYRVKPPVGSQRCT